MIYIEVLIPYFMADLIESVNGKEMSSILKIGFILAILNGICSRM